MTQNNLYLLGYASGIAGAAPDVGRGPENINNVVFDEIFFPQPETTNQRVDQIINHLDTQLAKKTAELTQQSQRFVVVGGDHTSAIGTWSGVQQALHQQGDIGLIWVDAHMDSHTPETTESGRIHGMPLAALMGYGYPTLIAILNDMPKLKPENICLIGVRSYESGEAALLKRLNVRVYFIEEVKQRGLKIIFDEAIKQVTKNTIGFGVSLDLDAIDPKEAPGVGVPTPDGLRAADVLMGMKVAAQQPTFMGAEIVEFDPSKDKEKMTEKLIVKLIGLLEY